jgi:hypothetical protein
LKNMLPISLNVSLFVLFKCLAVWVCMSVLNLSQPRKA